MTYGDKTPTRCEPAKDLIEPVMTMAPISGLASMLFVAVFSSLMSASHNAFSAWRKGSCHASDTKRDQH